MFETNKIMAYLKSDACNVEKICLYQDGSSFLKLEPEVRKCLVTCDNSADTAPSSDCKM